MADSFGYGHEGIDSEGRRNDAGSRDKGGRYARKERYWEEVWFY
jgi:hypothetical protein